MALFKRNSNDFSKENVAGFTQKFSHYASQYKKLTQTKNPPIDLPGSFRDFEKLWGKPLPDYARKIFRTLHQIDYPIWYRWETAPLRTDIVKEEGNIVEAVLLKAQIEFPTDHHIDWFTGSIAMDNLVNIGGTWSGENISYQLPIYEAEILQKEEPQVYYFKHHSPDQWGMEFHAMSKNISSFLFGMIMFHTHFVEKTLKDSEFSSCVERSKEQLQLDYNFFRSKRINRRWISTYDFSYQNNSRGGNLTLDYFQRARWIMELLKGNHNNYLSSIAYNMFNNGLNPELDNNRHQQNLRHLPTHVPDALYYLFRCFFLDENEQLDEYIRVCKDSRSRIIRDAALLVEEFKNGRTFFGEVDDLSKLKADFKTTLDRYR